MPQRDHSNVWPADPQTTADQDWQRLVEQRFPADLQAQACELKAFVRARGLPSALHLLRELLYYVLSQSSLREPLCVEPVDRPDKYRHLWPSLAQTLAGQRILLVDATHVSCRDKRADTWRLHMAYDLLAGRLAWVRISTQQVGEGAYSRAKQRLSVAAAQAFCLVRYSAAHLPLYAPLAPAWTREHRVDVLAWLRTLPPGHDVRQAMVVEQQDYLPVRLIALVLPEEQAEALRRQKQRQARDKGRTLSPEALLLAGFVLLVTWLLIEADVEQLRRQRSRGRTGRVPPE
jgi:hypothetical protein